MNKKVLKEGEEVIILKNPHWIILFPRFFSFLIFIAFMAVIIYIMLVHGLLSTRSALSICGVVLLIWLPFLIYPYLVRITTNYCLTNHRLILEFGILNKTSKSSQLEKINDITHHQSLLGRLLNYGDLVIETAGEMGATRIKSIGDPIIFKNKILEEVSRFRARRSGRIPDHQGEKKCPECAEWIKEEAKVCRFCHYRFS